MCWSCFKKYADEPVVNDRVVAVARLIRDVGEEGHFSPLLHIMVEDMNLEDGWFDLANRPINMETETSADWRDRMTRRRSYDNAEQWERDIFDALAALSEAERATAVAMDWGYVDLAGKLREDLQ